MTDTPKTPEDFVRVVSIGTSRTLEVSDGAVWVAIEHVRDKPYSGIFSHGAFIQDAIRAAVEAALEKERDDVYFGEHGKPRRGE